MGRWALLPSLDGGWHAVLPETVKNVEDMTYRIDLVQPCCMLTVDIPDVRVAYPMVHLDGKAIAQILEEAANG